MKISLVTRSFLLLTADHAIAFILNSNAGESFKVGKRRFSHAAIKSSYLDSLEPENPKGTATDSYMAKKVTNPKPSAVTSYLDTVGTSSVDSSNPASYESSSSAPAATSSDTTYSSAQSTSSADQSYPHSFKYTYSQKDPSQKGSYKNSHSITQKIDRPAQPVAAASSSTETPTLSSTATAGDAATGDYLSALASNAMSSGGGVGPTNYLSNLGSNTMAKPSGGSNLGSSYLEGVVSAAAVSNDYPAASSPPSSETAAPEPEPIAPAAESTLASSSGDYLSALASNAMSSGGGVGPASYLSNLGSSTVAQPSGGTNLGSSYLEGVASAAAVSNDYSAAPAVSSPPPAKPVFPAASIAPAAESTPAPLSGGDYLGALGSNVMSSGGGGAGPANYLSILGSNTMTKPSGGSDLGNSYTSSLNGAPDFLENDSAPLVTTTEGSIDQRFEAAMPHLSSLAEQAEETTSSMIETEAREAELIPTSNNHAYDTFVSGLKVVTTDMGKSMREAVDVLAQSGEQIAASIKRSSVTLAASNIIGNDGLNDNDMENRLALLKRTVDEMK